jgi:hypothetical protein
MFAPRNLVAAASIALILLMTLTRLGPRALVRLVDAIDGSVEGWLVALALNVLLFVPLGMAVGWTRRPYLLVAAPVISITIEVTQLLLPTRNADPLDVVANTSGAVVGFLVVTLWARSIRSGESAPGDEHAPEPQSTEGRDPWRPVPDSAD